MGNMRCDHCYRPGAAVYHRPLLRRITRRPAVVRYLCDADLWRVRRG